LTYVVEEDNFISEAGLQPVRTRADIVVAIGYSRTIDTVPPTPSLVDAKPNQSASDPEWRFRPLRQRQRRRRAVSPPRGVACNIIGTTATRMKRLASFNGFDRRSE